MLSTIPEQPMRQCGLPMLYEGHVMVVVQLVMHFFLQACFIPNFKQGMSEELFFSESHFLASGELCYLSQRLLSIPIGSAKSAIWWLVFAVEAAICLISEKVKCFQHARRCICG